jgi:hypothetical protein
VVKWLIFLLQYSLDGIRTALQNTLQCVPDDDYAIGVVQELQPALGVTDVSA